MTKRTFYRNFKRALNQEWENNGRLPRLTRSGKIRIGNYCPVTLVGKYLGCKFFPISKVYSLDFIFDNVDDSAIIVNAADNAFNCVSEHGCTNRELSSARRALMNACADYGLDFIQG